MTDLRSLWLSIYLGPAIVYVKRYLWEELTIFYNLQDIRPDLYHILYAGDLVKKDRLTEKGNTVFACTSLVEYHVLTCSTLMKEHLNSTQVGKKHHQINYHLLRKGLGEQIHIQSIDYLAFMREAILNNPETILDICGGNGTYLYLIGEMFQSDHCFLMDKDVNSAIDNLDLNNPDRYMIHQHPDPRTYNIPWPYKADLVLLNEVLHLKKQDSWWTECIGSALRNSKKDAYICIGELLSDSTFDWRMRSLTSDGKRLCIDEFQDFLCDHYKGIFNHNFNYIETDTHWFCILKRNNR